MKVAEIENDILVIKNREDEKLNGRKGALVKVLGCGLCGSDIVKLTQHRAKQGTVLGHEIVAFITDINSDTNFKVGDTIITSHHIPCGKCEYCKMGMFLCADILKKQTFSLEGSVSMFCIRRTS